MIRKREMPYGLVAITALTLILGCAKNSGAQKPDSESLSFPDFLRMAADQPDHMADRTIAFNDTVVKMKLARKQDKVRNEVYPLDQADSLKSESYRNYRIVTISELNHPTMALDPQEKTYAEAPESFKLASFDLEDYLKKASAELGQIKPERAGTEIIEGHKANRIRLRFEGSSEEMYFYFAIDLKNLFLKMDSGTVKQIKGSYTVTNVSLDVPDELFEIPKDYKRVDFNSMISTIKQKAIK